LKKLLAFFTTVFCGLTGWSTISQVDENRPRRGGFSSTSSCQVSVFQPNVPPFHSG
jgi:hypothetical protein